MSLLLLGGTADGRQLAASLHRQGVPVIYSVAGLVRRPDVACPVVSGGFTQFGGLAAYIRQHAVTAVLDVTHPYAVAISSAAVAAAKACDIPCWRFHRPQWHAQQGDTWRACADWEQVCAGLAGYHSVLLTCGQLTRPQLDSLAAADDNRQYILRTAVAPVHVLPDGMRWIKAIGPFAIADELALLRHYQVDVLVSKNSGGHSTVAKLHAARMLKVPVLMLARPSLPGAVLQFDNRADCEAHVLSVFPMQGEPNAL